jgi:HNH endonuclease
MGPEKRFVLVERSNAERYLVKTHRKDAPHVTGFGYGEKGHKRITTDIGEVIRAALRGEPVWATAPDNQTNLVGIGREDGLNLRFYVASEFEHLVEKSPLASWYFKPGALARTSLQTLTPAPSRPSAEDDEAILRLMTAEWVKDAYERTEDSLTFIQRSMLSEHASSPGATASLRDLAQAHTAGPTDDVEDDYRQAAAILRNAMMLPARFEGMKTLATDIRSEDGTTIWKLRPQVVAGLSALGVGPLFASTEEPLSPEDEVENDPQCRGLPDTAKKVLTDARIGQGDYRRRMLRLWGGKCAITACAIERTLIASHAKAWKLSTNEERLDVFNGLLLSASVDRLFDAGLISVADDGQVLFDKTLDTKELALIGLYPSSRVLRIHEKHRPYLAAHRIAYGFA